MYKVKKSDPRKQCAYSLRKELKGYEKEGTLLYLEDQPSRPEEIVNSCVFSESNQYMRDFISDEHQRITEIHFIRVE